MIWYKKLLISLLIAVVGVIAYLFLYISSAQLESQPIVDKKVNNRIYIINNKPINLEIARTSAEHYQGLSDRQDLCSTCGMLFVFPNLETRSFVMRRMNFPLDIIWIKKDQVVGVSRNLSPEGIEPIAKYSSPEPVDLVLEIPAGQADYYQLSEGISVNLISQLTGANK